MNTDMKPDFIREKRKEREHNCNSVITKGYWRYNIKSLALA